MVIVGWALLAAMLGIVAWLMARENKQAPPNTASTRHMFVPAAPAPRVTVSAVDATGAPVDPDEHPEAKQLLLHPVLIEIMPMMEAGEWGIARRYLQKIAYGIANGTPDEQRVFKAVMTAFAEVDPLYRVCIRQVLPLVLASPGIKQTALYPHMSSAPDVEHARYVLYFAHEIGDIVRKKKGNGYLVFPGGTQL